VERPVEVDTTVAPVDGMLYWIRSLVPMLKKSLRARMSAMAAAPGLDHGPRGSAPAPDPSERNSRRRSPAGPACTSSSRSQIMEHQREPPRRRPEEAASCVRKMSLRANRNGWPAAP